MWSLLERAKKIIFATVLSIIPLVFLYAQSKDTSLREVLARPVIELSGYIEKSTLAIVGGVSDFLYKYFFLAGRNEELLALRSKIQETEALKMQVQDLINSQASILELYFNSPLPAQARKEFAKIVARAGAPMSRLIRIDRGQKHGLKAGNPVIAHEGAVGHVIAVASNFSDVLLISDATSAMEVKVVNSGLRGLLRGASTSRKYLMEIKNIEGQSRIYPGDKIISSGQNSYFPGGIPVGVVKEVNISNDDDLNSIALVEPVVNLEQLEHVVILLEEKSRNESISAVWPLMVE